MITAVYIDWGSGWVDLTDYSGLNLVHRDSISKINQIHDEECRTARNSVKFRITSNVVLVPHLRDNSSIKVQIERDEAVWFVGYVRPVTEFSDSVMGETIDLEAFDSSWLLESTLQDDEQFQNKYICNTSDTDNSIVHQLLLSAGVAAGDIAISTDILQQITMTFEEGTKYLDAINGLLWDYHHVATVSDAGDFYLYDWAPDPVPSYSQIFFEDNIIGELKERLADVDEDQARVIYHELISLTDITLCKKTYSDVTNATLFKVLDTSVCYEWDEADEQATVADGDGASDWPSEAGRFKFDSPVEDAEWLFTENHEVSWYNRRFWNSTFVGIGAGGETDNNDVTLKSSSFGASYADLQFTISDPSKPWYASASWNTMRSVTIKGDATLLKRHVNKTDLIPAGGNFCKDYKANYIYDAITAVALATAISHNLTYGKHRYEWTSRVAADAGDYVLVHNTTALNVSQVVRVLSVTWDEGRRLYTYTGMGVTSLGTPVGAIISGVYRVLPTGDIVDAIARVNEGLDEAGDLARILKGPSLPGESEESVVGLTGLYFTRDQLGFYNGAESVNEWMVRIKNDGTFLFRGDDDNALEWTGSQLLYNGDAQSKNFSSGSAGWQILNAGDAEFNEITVRGAIYADSGEIGGWVIGETSIASNDEHEQFAIRSNTLAQEIRDAAGNMKIILGYMGNAPVGWVNADGDQLDGDDYGLYVAGGNMVVAEGARFENGDYFINHDAAYIIYKDASPDPIEVGRFGSLGAGEPVGLKIGTIDYSAGTGSGIYVDEDGNALFSGTLTVGSLPYLTDDDLEAYWSFDDGVSGSADGDTATDNSGNGHDATIDGCAWVPGVSGFALQFDGTDDYADTTYSNPASYPFSVSFWFSYDDYTDDSGYRYILDNSPGSAGFAIRKNPSSDGKLHVFSYGSAGSHIVLSGEITDNNKHHLGVVFEATKTTIYVDGVENNSRTYTSDTFVPGADTLTIGSAVGGGGNYFDGSIDEPRIYSRALSANEVKYLYLNPGGPSGRTVISGNSITTGVIKSSGYSAGTSGMYIDLENDIIQSGNFSTGVSGFKLDGDANEYEFNGKMGGTGFLGSIRSEDYWEGTQSFTTSSDTEDDVFDWMAANSGMNGNAFHSEWRNVNGTLNGEALIGAKFSEVYVPSPFDSYSVIFYSESYTLTCEKDSSSNIAYNLTLTKISEAPVLSSDITPPEDGYGSIGTYPYKFGSVWANTIFPEQVNFFDNNIWIRNLAGTGIDIKAFSFPSGTTHEDIYDELYASCLDLNGSGTAVTAMGYYGTAYLRFLQWYDEATDYFRIGYGSSSAYNVFEDGPTETTVDIKIMVLY